ncbi:MAG TPA: hypothetical protein V6C89_01245 [Drouetiella sp.]
MKTKKTPFWLIPILGVVSFLLFEVVFFVVLACLVAYTGLVHESHIQFAGRSWNVNYGYGAGVFVTLLVAVAGVLSAMTTMMLLHSSPKMLPVRNQKKD